MVCGAVPTHEQGITILGTPLGHEDFVQGQLDEKIDEHRVLLDRISKVPDLQCAWLLLLLCAASRANYMLRVVHPALSFRFAQMRDAGIWECFHALARPVTQHMWETSLPFALGGLCLRNAERLRSTAHWASWADTLPVIRARHPDVAEHAGVTLQRCGWVPLGGSQ